MHRRPTIQQTQGKKASSPVVVLVGQIGVYNYQSGKALRQRIYQESPRFFKEF
jgi:hypothetical protein